MKYDASRRISNMSQRNIQVKQSLALKLNIFPNIVSGIWCQYTKLNSAILFYHKNFSCEIVNLVVFILSSNSGLCSLNQTTILMLISYFVLEIQFLRFMDSVPDTTILMFYLHSCRMLFLWRFPF